MFTGIIREIGRVEDVERSLSLELAMQWTSGVSSCADSGGILPSGGRRLTDLTVTTGEVALLDSPPPSAIRPKYSPRAAPSHWV